MKIQEVTIEGFQSHIQSTFSLSPGLTVITGPSDAGKTAIIRALRWFAFNEPTGEAFIHTIRNQDGSVKQAAEQARVSVTFDDGTTITKTRRKGKTTYTHSDYPTPWEKAEVPPEIKETLGLLKQEYGDFETCLNFAYQLDAPFLLSETASVGAKVLGKLAGTEVVDLAISDVNKKTHQTRNAISYEDKQIGEIDVQLTEYFELDNTDAALTAVEAVFNNLKEDQKKWSELIQLSARNVATIDKIIALQERLDKLSAVFTCRTDLEIVERSDAKKAKLRQLATDFWEAVKSQKEPARIIRKTKDIPEIRQRLTNLETDFGVTLVQLNAAFSLYQYRLEQIQAASAILEKTSQAPLWRSRLAATKAADNNAKILRQLNQRLWVSMEAERNLRQELGALDMKIALRAKYEALEADYKALDSLKRLSAVLVSRELSYNAAKDNVSRCGQAIDVAEKELHEAWEDAGGVCPLCGSEGVRGWSFEK